VKGDERLIRALDDLLADELTAINQYMVHSEMCNNWGYERLHERIEKRAIEEMRHAEKLIERILFLEGMPTVSKLNEIHIGADIPKQFAYDLEAEKHAVQRYNEAIQLAGQVNDAVSRELLEHILKDEDAHVDWLEAQLDQVAQIGLPVYLSVQVKQ
jgi:bacterioferritin